MSNPEKIWKDVLARKSQQYEDDLRAGVLNAGHDPHDTVTEMHIQLMRQAFEDGANWKRSIGETARMASRVVGGRN